MALKQSLSKEILNRIAWDVGHRYPAVPTSDHIALYMVHPRLAHIHWHIDEASLEALRARLGDGFHNCRFVVRVYDVTDVIFDGHNAHSLFDIEVEGPSGNRYFGIGKAARNYCAASGIRPADGSFHPLARSGTAFFDREGPSKNYRTEGLFSGGIFGGDFAVENIFDARIFEKLNRALSEARVNEMPSVAVVFAKKRIEHAGGKLTGLQYLLALAEALGVPLNKVETIAYAARHQEHQRHQASINPTEVKSRFGLNPDGPLVLFAGELSYGSGADLFADALPTVCNKHETAQFIIVGGGPLRGELEGRISRAGLNHRCRFAGDVQKEIFDSLLLASDFVVIPARSRQDWGLARLAIDSAVPVVTTHQAGLGCVTHGANGLVTYDNVGSIVWGMQEMLMSNPLEGRMLRYAARRRAHESPSVEAVAAKHLILYLEEREGVR